MLPLLSAGFLSGCLTIIVGFHLYWALGGRWLSDRVIPTRRDGAKLFQPSALATLIAAGYLLLVLALVLAVLSGRDIRLGQGLLRGLLIAAGCIFLLRAMGDFRHIGFSKRLRGTKFAQADDWLFSPLVLLMGLSSLVVALS